MPGQRSITGVGITTFDEELRVARAVACSTLPPRLRCTNPTLIGVDDRGWSEFHATAADGDIPSL
jgi:hypothetical protein